MDFQEKGLLGIVGGLGVMIFLFWVRTFFVPASIDYPIVETISPENSFSDSMNSSQVCIQISGQVMRPGVYDVTANLRVGEVLVVAGGPLSTADLDRVNLVRRVADGMRIRIPALKKDSRSLLNPSSSQRLAFVPVNLNRSSIEDLITIPGIGPVMAQRIVDDRSLHGPFRMVSDLKRVKGVGEKTLQRLSRYVSVDF